MPAEKVLYGSALVTIGAGSSTEAQRIANAGTYTATIAVANNAASGANKVILGNAASSTATFTDAVDNVVTFNFTIDGEGNITNNTKTVYVRVDGGVGDIGDSVSAVAWATTYPSTQPSIKVNSAVTPVL